MTGGAVKPAGCTTEECAQFSGVLENDMRSKVTQARKVLPICRVVRKLAGIACAYMRSCDPTTGKFERKEFVHITHDDHVRIQKDDTLSQS